MTARERARQERARQVNLAWLARNGQSSPGTTSAPATLSSPVAPTSTTTVSATDVLAIVRTLAHQGSGSGLVALADVLERSGLSLASLHAAIQSLRRDGKLSGVAYEGRHGADRRIIGAAIMEHGEPISHVLVRE